MKPGTACGTGIEDAVLLDGAGGEQYDAADDADDHGIAQAFRHGHGYTVAKRDGWTLIRFTASAFLFGDASTAEPQQRY